jgi:NADH:ubiquinone oxidoreductase subunit E
MKQKHEITICLGSSCFARGSKEILKAVKLWLREHEMEESVFFHGDLCRGRCENGPILVVNDKVFSKMKKEMVDEILEESFG